MHYLASDHLSSATLMMDSSGTMVSSRRYLPFGEERTAVGTWLSDEDGGYTDLGYTSQRNYAGFGLMDYHARFYSPALGRFSQPDTIIPGVTNTQSWNRYSYVNNSPILYNDPTGHFPWLIIPIVFLLLGTSGCDTNGNNPPPSNVDNDVWVDEAESLEGDLGWCNPFDDCKPEANEGIQDSEFGTAATGSDFFDYYYQDIKTDANGNDIEYKINSMNCWEFVLYSSMQEGLIDEAWVDDFYNTAFNLSTRYQINESIWDQLGADTATSYTGNADRGQVIFFESSQSSLPGLPGHIAISVGGNQVISLWDKPGGNYSVQITTVDDIVAVMPGTVTVTVTGWNP